MSVLFHKNEMDVRTFFLPAEVGADEPELRRVLDARAGESCQFRLVGTSERQQGNQTVEVDLLRLRRPQQGIENKTRHTQHKRAGGDQHAGTADGHAGSLTGIKK